jgi:LemA protein
MAIDPKKHEMPSQDPQVRAHNFNEVARQFNTMIRRFPTNIIANMMGVEKRNYFEATQGAEQAPQVQF